MNLTTNYLSRLSVAYHDGVTQQIYDRLSAFETDKQLLIDAIQLVGTRRQAEDVAFKHFSAKDFTSDDLKKEDTLGDNYMSAALGILNGLLALPEEEPLYRKAQMAKQVFKDFNFSTSDGFEAEARKIINMAQQWAAATEYTLAELGIEAWVQKAEVQANKVLELVALRVDHESQKIKGELADARKATDAAIREAYVILNALAVLQPSEALNSLIAVLLSIEDRAKTYYISGASASSGNKPNAGGGTTPEQDGGSEQGGTNTNDGDDDTPPPSGGGGFPGSDEIDQQNNGGSGDDNDTPPTSGGGGFGG